MSRTFRFAIAGVLALSLILLATQVWAGPRKQGTVPLPPNSGQGIKCNTNKGGSSWWNGTVTAEVVGSCTFNVTAIDSVTAVEKYGPAPEGKAYYAHVLNVAINGAATFMQVCFAYPPELEAKNARIHFFKDGKWVEEEGKIVDGPPRQLCYSSDDSPDAKFMLQGADFALIGDQ